MAILLKIASLKSSSVNMPECFVCVPFVSTGTPRGSPDCNSSLARLSSRGLCGSSMHQFLPNAINTWSRDYRPCCHRNFGVHICTFAQSRWALALLTSQIELRAEPFLGGSSAIGGAADLSFRNLATLRNVKVTSHASWAMHLTQLLWHTEH